MSMIKIFVLSKKGAMSIEYALIAFVIGIGLIAGLHKNKQAIIDKYCEIGNQLNPEDTSLSVGCRRKMAANIDVGYSFKDSGVFLKAGQTVEISPEGSWRVTLYGAGRPQSVKEATSHDPFNSMNTVDPNRRLSIHDYIAPAGHVMPAFGAMIKSTPNSDIYTNFNSDPSANMSIAQNGKLRITAQQDGYLHMGIHDYQPHYGDNEVLGDNAKVNVHLVE